MRRRLGSRYAVSICLRLSKILLNIAARLIYDSRFVASLGVAIGDKWTFMLCFRRPRSARAFIQFVEWFLQFSQICCFETQFASNGIHCHESWVRVLSLSSFHCTSIWSMSLDCLATAAKILKNIFQFHKHVDPHERKLRHWELRTVTMNRKAKLSRTENIFF